MKTKIFVVFLLLAAGSAVAQNFAVTGSCALPGQAVVVSGLAQSGTLPLTGSPGTTGSGVIASYPQCLVTVFPAQSGTPVPTGSIFSNAGGAALGNPFTANTDGSWTFYAAGACYDVVISSGVIPSSQMPVTKTLSGLCAGGGGGGGGGGGPLPNPAVFPGPASFATFTQHGTNYQQGMGSVFMPDDPGGAATYDGGPTNTLDQIKDLFGILLFCPLGTQGACLQLLGVSPLPPGIPPQNGSVPTWVNGVGYQQGDGNIEVTSVNNTSDYADISQAVGDMCIKISQEEYNRAIDGSCKDIDARGFTGTQACSINPFPSNSCSNVILPKATIQIAKTWILPHGVGLYGTGNDNNPCAGAGTCLQIQPGLTGPAIAWGNNGSAASGQVIQYSPVRNLQVDCNNVVGAVGIQDFNAQEGSGAWDVKIPNCGMSGVGLEVGGPSFPLSDSFTTSGTTLTDNTAANIDNAWVNAKLAIPAGGATYTVVSVASATGSSTATLSGTPTCSGCTIAVAGASSQNGTLERLNVSYPANTATCPASGKAAIPIVINTGSALFPGPKRVDNITVTNACVGTIQPVNAMQVSGTGIDLQDMHTCEGFTGSCVILGLDAVTDNIGLQNIWSSNSATGSAVLTISNNHAVSNIHTQNIKAIGPNLPTNTINDQNNIAITTAAFTTVSEYVTGKSGVVVFDSTGTNSFGGPIGTAVASSITLTGFQGVGWCTTTCTVTIPAPVAGSSFCVYNDNNVSSTITLNAIVGVQYQNTNGTTYKTANTSFVSGGAVLDSICVYGKDTTHYNVVKFHGTWT